MIPAAVEDGKIDSSGTLYAKVPVVWEPGEAIASTALQAVILDSCEAGRFAAGGGPGGDIALLQFLPWLCGRSQHRDDQHDWYLRPGFTLVSLARDD
jgi:hypothetical protein